MSKYVRKTYDEYHTQGDYGCGWETVTIDDNLADARQMLRDYNENEIGIKHRIVKKRILKGENA